ncbi:bifunctional metallophosphatase/5'-nucleotidase [Hymenobacter segetis]|uniref:Bifunctional UDP-sugar hydrolase/5'-nucleotidase n=1 Tax=Hymenobacter segetis TaxID=2025509 RepID=A0ABU9M104_9BACT
MIGLLRAQPVTTPVPRSITLLYTNDFHCAIDPIPAYWLPGQPRVGGAAHLATLVNRIRQRDSTVFLFDAGDMFTGTQSFLSRGAVMMEMMRAMRYDAMAIGNHEFDYGSDNFTRQMNRVPFPILGANIFFQGTDHPYCRPSVILERNGLRVGVIGIIGADARDVSLKTGVATLDFRDPVPLLQAAVDELKPQVDLIVVLAHQGQTGPMQTDAEAHPDLQRAFAEDIRVCGAVRGIDVFVGGHAHRGIEQPYVHSQTGTLIVQTYGYGTRLGYLTLQVKGGQVLSHRGELLKVYTDSLPPDPAVVRALWPYQQQLAREMGPPLANAPRRLVRDYRTVSPLGAFVADVMRATSGADVAFVNAGGLRADLPQGPVTRAHVLDALPFENTLVMCTMSGTQVLEALRHGLTRERGMLQFSGLRVRTRRDGTLEQVLIGGKPLVPARSYSVAVSSFIQQGGDLYEVFTHASNVRDSGKLISSIICDYLRQHGFPAAESVSRFEVKGK